MFNLKASELALAMTTQPKRIQVRLQTNFSALISVSFMLETLVLIADYLMPQC